MKEKFAEFISFVAAHCITVRQHSGRMISTLFSDTVPPPVLTEYVRNHRLTVYTATL